VVEERPAVFVDCFQGGCSKGDDRLVFGWNGRSFEPAHLMEDDGIYFFF
jgi:hypothetical protein